MSSPSANSDPLLVFRFLLPTFSSMNTSENPDASRTPAISSEALIGIGITIAALGILCLLLGLAEHLRSVANVALVWFVLGTVLAIAGALVAGFGWSRKRSR
jgi:hypothetical protein